MYLLPRAAIRTELHLAWQGSAMLAVGADGRIGQHALTGFWFRQARFLARLRLLLAGAPPHPCSIAQTTADELELTYVFPEVVDGDGGGSGSGGRGERYGLLYRNVDLHVRQRVRPASLEVVLTLTSRWQDDVELDVAWELGADFATIEEANFGRREQDAPVQALADGAELRFVYGHERLPFETHVRATGADWRAGAGEQNTLDATRALDAAHALDAAPGDAAPGDAAPGDATGGDGFPPASDGVLRARVRLRRQTPVELTLRVVALDREDPVDEAGESRRRAALAAWRSGVVELHAPGESPLVEFANRAALDLGSMALLDGPEDEWLAPGAGLPLYQALWARDALTASWQAGLLDRGAMLEHVLTRLARLQGTVVDASRDEQPGRIINQAKRDPLSRLGVSGFDRNYADVASPFMFIIGLGYHYVLSGDRAHVARHWDAALRVLGWADEYGDRSRGYIEYLTRAPRGPRHQAWKDSDNAVVDHEGRQVEPPIASCEIQGYWFISLQFMAVLSLVMGERRRALELWRRAAALKERFNRDFWMEDEGYLAFGLDAAGAPIRALTSNAAQCLPTGVVSQEHVPRLVRRMFEPDLFSGWGVRTLSTRNPAYNPLDYHLGSVWPVENGSILFGLRRYGQDERVHELARGLYDLARLWPGGRTPECVGGYGRDEAAHPGAYPRANAPQAWNQSVWPMLVQSLLGVVPFAPMKLLLVDPILPPWLPELTVRGLRVGEARVTLRFTRDADGRSHHDVLEQEGTLRVLRQPWLESQSADAWQRLSGVLHSIL